MAEPHVQGDVLAINGCLRHAPHFHAVALGPVPFGRAPGERVTLLIDVILTHTREEAEEVVWEWVRRACEATNHPFDQDEWDVQYVLPRNCN